MPKFYLIQHGTPGELDYSTGTEALTREDVYQRASDKGATELHEGATMIAFAVREGGRVTYLEVWNSEVGHA